MIRLATRPLYKHRVRRLWSTRLPPRTHSRIIRRQALFPISLFPLCPRHRRLLSLPKVQMLTSFSRTTLWFATTELIRQPKPAGTDCRRVTKELAMDEQQYAGRHSDDIVFSRCFERRVISRPNGVYVATTTLTILPS